MIITSNYKTSLSSLNKANTSKYETKIQFIQPEKQTDDVTLQKRYYVFDYEKSNHLEVLYSMFLAFAWVLTLKMHTNGTYCLYIVTAHS